MSPNSECPSSWARVNRCRSATSVLLTSPTEVARSGSVAQTPETPGGNAPVVELEQLNTLLKRSFKIILSAAAGAGGRQDAFLNS